MTILILFIDLLKIKSSGIIMLNSASPELKNQRREISMAIFHVIRSQQFDRDILEKLFATAKEMEEIVARGGSDILRDRIAATLFYEPSTRTRFSFEAAMRRLGGSIISTENAPQFSSAAKGETLEDTIQVVGGYVDVIILRHYEVGAAEKAAAVSSVPVINAGDGPGQHPTQALLDLYTIQKELGQIDGIKVALVGDLANGRTVRSLAYLLAKFEGVELYFVAPQVVAMRQDIKDYLTRHNIPFQEEADLAKVARLVDVIYQTRIQKERFDDVHQFEEAYGRYIIDKTIVSLMKERSILLHPLPRVNEITKDVDRDPRAAFFRQAHNGLYVRMALLKMILAPEK